ncbi:hypothetical protein ACOJBO_12715 [Rhizobium beringeri]
MYQSWLIGLVRNRSGRLFGTIGGVALTVAFIACLGAFLQSSAVEMTARSIAQVPVDWQVQLLPEGRHLLPSRLRSVLPHQPPNCSRSAMPTYRGLRRTLGTQCRPPVAAWCGIEPSYLAQFPAQVRRLLGSADGVPDGAADCSQPACRGGGSGRRPPPSGA